MKVYGCRTRVPYFVFRFLVVIDVRVQFLLHSKTNVAQTTLLDWHKTIYYKRFVIKNSNMELLWRWPRRRAKHDNCIFVSIENSIGIIPVFDVKIAYFLLKRVFECNYFNRTHGKSNIFGSFISENTIKIQIPYKISVYRKNNDRVTVFWHLMNWTIIIWYINYL